MDANGLLHVVGDVPEELAQEEQNNQSDAGLGRAVVSGAGRTPYLNTRFRILHILEDILQYNGLKKEVKETLLKTNLTGPTNWKSMERATRKRQTRNLVLPNCQTALLRDGFWPFSPQLFLSACQILSNLSPFLAASSGPAISNKSVGTSPT